MGGEAAAIAAASVSAAMANAVKACGTIVHVEPDAFLKILSFQKNPLIVHQIRRRFFSTSYNYLTSYKGLAFFCRSQKELNLPGESEWIHAKKMAIPDM